MYYVLFGYLASAFRRLRSVPDYPFVLAMIFHYCFCGNGITMKLSQKIAILILRARQSPEPLLVWAFWGQLGFF